MIVSAKYVSPSVIVVVLDDEDRTVLSVPDDMANRHRQELAEWEASGKAIEPWEEPPATKPAPIVDIPAELAALKAETAELRERLDALTTPAKVRLDAPPPGQAQTLAKGARK